MGDIQVEFVCWVFRLF